MLWNEDQLPRVKKETKAYVERTVGECYQWKAHGQCSKGDSCSISHHTQAPGNWRRSEARAKDEKSDRLLPHPIRSKNRLTARNKNPHRYQAKKTKAIWTRVKCHAVSNSVKKGHVSSGILSCVRIASLKNDVYVATNAISDMLRQMESPARCRKRVVQKGSVAMLRDFKKLGCVSQGFLSKKIYST